MHGPPLSQTMTAGGALLTRLKALGVDYVFANSGTDFPPIIEGLAEAQASGRAVPEALVIPHEHVALGMAHGYTLATGRPQAVMMHTNVGLANGTIGAINAATDNIPMLLMSGRTPTTEKGRFGARTVPIGWGQEMRDQAALVREAVKWDYELRFPEQIDELLDRAVALSTSPPQGPVYISLPREILCEPCPSVDLERPASMMPVRTEAPPRAIKEAAKLLADAKRPLIVAQRGAGSVAGFDALAQLAEDWAIPICQYWAIALAVRSDHPCYIGMNPEPWVGWADVILVIDSLAPWSPDIHQPAAGCSVIQMGPDPLQSRFPVRNFQSQLSIATETADGLCSLLAAMPKRTARRQEAIDRRRDEVMDAATRDRAAVAALADTDSSGRMTKAWVSRCIGAAVRGREATILSELGAPLAPMGLSQHGSWRQEPCSGGLGWSFPCGMGMKLAEPDRLVIATMGDGSYMFANPVACHQVAEAYRIPLVAVILNNAEWGAVRQSVMGLYPAGHAARTNTMPLTSLQPSPDFAAVARASRAYAETVEKAEDLAPALSRAMAAAEEEGRPALLDVKVAP
jgi:acetolactate synthase-1/2/3 large subunit